MFKTKAVFFAFCTILLIGFCQPAWVPNSSGDVRQPPKQPNRNIISLPKGFSVTDLHSITQILIHKERSVLPYWRNNILAIEVLPSDKIQVVVTPADASRISETTYILAKDKATHKWKIESGEVLIE